jgi:Tol biopolymer transport system component
MTTPFPNSKRRLAVLASFVALTLFWPLAPADATYPGNNGEIAYFSDDGLRAIDADGSNDRSYISGSRALAISFSSDGSTAVLAEYLKNRPRIFLVDLATHARTVVMHAKDAPTQEVFSVALSPDASTIAFCDGFPGNVWTVASDGTALTEIAKGYCFADWGVDGRIVASKGIFHYDGDRVLTTMDADGGNKQVIATLPPVKNAWGTIYSLVPSWSPDGSTVVFGAQNTRLHPDIWSVGSDGSDLHRLTHTTDWESGAVFSPDGLRIVYSKRIAGTQTSNLWTMDADGANQAVFLHTPHRDEYPRAWRPI